MRAAPEPSSSTTSPALRSSAWSMLDDALVDLDVVAGQLEVRKGPLLDRLLLRGHDPLEGRVARFVHARGDGDQCGQRRLDHVIPIRGLAVDLRWSPRPPRSSLRR